MIDIGNLSFFNNLKEYHKVHRDYFIICILYNLGNQRLKKIKNYFDKKYNHLYYVKYMLKNHVRKQCFKKTLSKIRKLDILMGLYKQTAESYCYENMERLKKGRENYVKFADVVASGSGSKELCEIMNWKEFGGVSVVLKEIENIVTDNFLENEKDLLTDHIIKKENLGIMKEYKKILEARKKKKSRKNVLDTILKESKNMK